MRLPRPLLRSAPDVYKNQFGHVCVIGGSNRMLGAAALTAIAAMRAGAGLVTVGVPQGLNAVMQRKVSNVVMTWPLKQTIQETLSLGAFDQIRKGYDRFDVIAIGPGISRHPSTQKLILKIISTCPKPLVIDADALNALSGNLEVLNKTQTLKVLTPHPGEMALLIGKNKEVIEKNRREIALKFAIGYTSIVVLKGHRTIVASYSDRGHTFVNTTGNAGMATAGSGDVLTGMIAALLAQGLSGFEAAKWGVYWHGKAGDFAARAKTKVSMIASDIIDEIPNALKLLNKPDA